MNVPEEVISIVPKYENNVPIDFIIPFHGAYESVRSLIGSIYRTVSGNPYNIYLVDDYSPNSSFIYSMLKMKNVTAIRNDSQMGFGMSLWEGFRAGKSPYVCIMHSDCLAVKNNWVQPMIKLIAEGKKERIKLVVPSTDNPNSTHDELFNFKTTDEISIESVRILKKGEVAPLYCAVFQRELFDHIGGFIKPYPYFGYENDELHYRMIKHKYNQAVCRKSFIQHKGGVTINKIKNRKIIDEANKNRDRCIEDLKTLV